MTNEEINIKRIRSKTGLTQTEFAKKFGIPKRTIENWEAGSRKCPSYLLALINEKVESEQKKEG